MRVGIVGVGLLSAGLEGWVKGREVLGGMRPFYFDSLPDPDAALLPANERRRSTAGVRWALHVAHEAMAQSRFDPRNVATVFASSGGEMGVLDQLCRALARPSALFRPRCFISPCTIRRLDIGGLPRAASNPPRPCPVMTIHARRDCSRPRPMPRWRAVPSCLSRTICPRPIRSSERGRFSRPSPPH